MDSSHDNLLTAMQEESCDFLSSGDLEPCTTRFKRKDSLKKRMARKSAVLLHSCPKLMALYTTFKGQNSKTKWVKSSERKDLLVKNDNQIYSEQKCLENKKVEDLKSVNTMRLDKKQAELVTNRVKRMHLETKRLSILKHGGRHLSHNDDTCLLLLESEELDLMDDLNYDWSEQVGCGL